MTRRLGTLFLASLLSQAAVAQTQTPEQPLRNVDIVRMSASGIGPERIIEIIRGAPATDFDLDPEIVVELIRAGVPQAVVDVMREVQPPAAPPAEDPPVAASVPLTIRFARGDSDHPEDRTAVFPAADGQGVPFDLLFFVACVDPTHVPAAWERSSLLAEGFPRHHLIGSVDRTVREEGKKKPRVILELPESLTLELEEGIHPLQLGVAVRHGDSAWQFFGGDEGRIEARAGEPARVEVRITTRNLKWLGRTSVTSSPIKVEILSLEPAATPAETE